MHSIYTMAAAALMRAGALLAPMAADSSRRVVVANEVARAARHAERSNAPMRMGSGDHLAFEAAQAKRARKAAARAARGH